jgi:hypothetical protein
MSPVSILLLSEQGLCLKQMLSLSSARARVSSTVLLMAGGFIPTIYRVTIQGREE